MVLISRFYDPYIKYVHTGAVPVFIPVDVDGKPRLYQSVILPTPEQLEEIRDRPKQWLLASVQAIRNSAVEDGYDIGDSL